jgi:hypothetical protein
MLVEEMNRGIKLQMNTDADRFKEWEISKSYPVDPVQKLPKKNRNSIIMITSLPCHYDTKKFFTVPHFCGKMTQRKPGEFPLWENLKQILFHYATGSFQHT